MAEARSWGSDLRLTRRERIKLLLKTVPDATASCPSMDGSRGVPSSTRPPRNQLWEQGSYHELLRCIDDLRRPYPKIRRHLLAIFVYPGDYDWARRVVAERGLDLLEAKMPSNVFVPADIVENAGFTPREAKLASRQRIAA